MNRLRARSLMEISQVQYGFMPDRGTRNAIFVLRRLAERSIQKQKDAFTCFIDYSKAFDTVKHASLFHLLSSLDIESHDIKLLANLYWNQQAAVRHNGELSESMNIKQGIRQGCVASPHLFALYTEMIVKKIEGKGGFRVGGTVINNLRYADDTVIIAETEEELQQLINIVVRESENKGLHLNGSKSFTMVFSKSTVIPTCNITIHGTRLEQVNSFIYLGRCVQNVRRRIGIAKSAFTSLETELKSRHINLQLRIRVLKCYVWSTLLYGSETWTLTSDLMKQLEATEMLFLRRMLRISYKDRVTNEEVLHRANEDRTLMKDIVKRQIDFFGHVIKKEELENLVITGFIEGKRASGRQRETYLTYLQNMKGMTPIELIHRERCLVTVVQIAGYANMIWHTMMMILI